MKPGAVSRPSQWYGRWCLLCVFVLGYILTIQRFPQDLAEYTLWSLVSFSAAVLPLIRLKRVSASNVVFWLVLLVFFVAYFVKFYLIASHIIFFRLGRLGHTEPDGAILLSSFRVVALAFLSFSLTFWLLPRQTRRTPSSLSVRKAEASYRLPALTLSGTALVLMTVTAVVSYATGISVMGAEQVRLPFKLAGAVFYGRFLLIPSLLLSAYYLGTRTKSSWLQKLPLALLVIHGSSEVLLRASRGQLTVLLVELFFLILMIKRRITRAALVLAGVIALCTVLLSPMITAYRGERIADRHSIYGPLSRSLAAFTSSSTPHVTAIEDGAHFVLFRITGVEMLINYLAVDVKPLGTGAIQVISNEGMARFVTISIFGYPASALHSEAVSSLGWFYLVGGEGFVYAGISILTIIIWWSWTALSRARLQVGPAIKASYLLVCYSILVDGVLDAQVTRILVLFACFLFIEYAARFLSRLSVRRTVVKSP